MNPPPLPPRADPALGRGFTLLEMIVVVAIVSILAAVAIPLWMHAQRNGRAAKCTGNLRQIGAGLTRYLGDHEQTFPALAMAREDKEQDVPVLDVELLPYVSDPQVFRCPEDAKQLFEKTGTSYHWNHKLNGQKLSGLKVSFVANDIIDDLSRIMVIGDKEGWHPYLVNKVNVLYADGHTSQELTFVDEQAEEQKGETKK